MAERVEAPVTSDRDSAGLASAGEFRPRFDSSFAALAEARFDWVNAKFLASGRWRGQGPPPYVQKDEIAGQLQSAERHYLEVKESFEQTHGKLIQEYWTSSDAGGVGVTSKDIFSSNLSYRLQLPNRQARFHRFTDYVCRRFPEVDEHLFSGDSLASICEEVLRGPTQRTALVQVYTAASQLLSSVDAMASQGVPDFDNDKTRRDYESKRKAKISRACVGYQKALARAERFYRDGASQAAQYHYFIGMLAGTIIVAGLAWCFITILPTIVGNWGLKVAGDEQAAGFTAVVSGALGASVSVMWRMTAGTFRNDAVFGKDNLRRLGAFRPFLGAMFGVILYMALQADLIAATYIPDDPGWHFYIFLAFLAGFSERLVPDFLGDREREMGSQPEESTKASENIKQDEIPPAPTITA